MRITTGSAKGRNIPLPKGAEVRPTSDRVKQALFNIMGQDLYGAAVLDLFCGSGNLGLEALSRGATLVAFCDRDRRCVGQARDLAIAWGLAAAKDSLFIEGAAETALARLAREHRRFDICFLDPPYDGEAGPKALADPNLARVMAPGATLAFEHAWGRELRAAPGLALVRQERYGSTGVSFFKLGADAHESD